MGALALVLVTVWLLAGRGTRPDSAGLGVPSSSDTFIPGDEEEILERLPPAATAEVRHLRERLGVAPDDLSTAVALARRHIEMARARADPRHLGYAQAALAPWWQLARPPLEVLLLRATIRQSLHDFAGGRADLDALLSRSPGHSQALLTRAIVAQVLGDHAAARRDCGALTGTVTLLVSTVCQAGVDGLTGSAAQASRALDQALRSSPQASTAERVWALTLLAELHVRLGEEAGAERHFRAALAGAPDDVRLLAIYADFLLDGGRPDEVVALLAGHEQVDGLLLRLAIAARAVGSAGAAGHVAALRARFDAARARGDRVHLREEARFELEVERDAGAALQLARANWDVQHEPADARVLLEAALAAAAPGAATPVLTWMADSKIEDPGLERLARDLERRRR